MVISALDNVEVRDDGFKYALSDISAGSFVIKYGMPIGRASESIRAGSLVHTHNLVSSLSGRIDYVYEPDFVPTKVRCSVQVNGFRRSDGTVGIRNDIWVIPTVACVNSLASRLAEYAGGFALLHPYGCSQLGADHESTVSVLSALAVHPNAGGVLIVGLGCENNTIDGMKERIGVGGRNIRFLSAQDVSDEYKSGCALIDELIANRVTEREPVPVSELNIGLKCGGSDAFSGITANPLTGRFADWMTSQGGAVVLTEVPEMFGAESILLRRCKDKDTFKKCAEMINQFKDYYISHGLPVSENPSPGNKAGGITTLEEKSLGCVQKGGAAPVSDVLPYAARVRRRGLSLLSAPGNDPVSCTALAAAGCHMILFTTGRGTPFGTVVPTVKISSNSALARKKNAWIDWDAEADQDAEALAEFVVSVANGTPVKNEINKCREIALFKNGVTL